MADMKTAMKAKEEGRLALGVIRMARAHIRQAEIDDGNITSEKMLTALELKYTIDSLQKNYNREIISFTDNIIQRNDNLLRNKININKNYSKHPDDLFEIFSQGDKIQIIEMAKNNVSGVEYSIQSNKIELENKIINKIKKLIIDEREIFKSSIGYTIFITPKTSPSCACVWHFKHSCFATIG